MATGSVKVIKRFNARKYMRNIQQEIGKQVQAVGKAHVQARRDIVSDFDTNIEFDYQVKVSEVQVTMSINVTNASQQLEGSEWTVGELWAALDKKGTPEHDIPKVPKQNGSLRFQWGGPGSYQAHTRPIAQSGGPGASSGEFVFRKQVHHPGFPPRKFSDKINKKLRPQFVKAIDNGIRIGGRKR